MSICVNRSVSFSDKALKKSLPRKLNHTLQANASVDKAGFSKGLHCFFHKARTTVCERRDCMLHTSQGLRQRARQPSVCGKNRANKHHHAVIADLTPVVPNVNSTTPASFHFALEASSDLVQYGSVSCSSCARLSSA